MYLFRIILCGLVWLFLHATAVLAEELSLSWVREVGFQKLVRSDEGAVYLPAANGFLYALRYENGEKLWRCWLGKTLAGPPVVTKDSITAVDDQNRVVNLSRQTGKENWSYQAEVAITAGPVVNGGLCYFTLKDGRVVAVNRWDGKLKWSFKTGEKIVAQPLVKGRDLYIGSKDKYFYAIDARKGELRWKFKSEGIITAGAAADKRRVYFSSWDGSIYALNRATGEVADSLKLKAYCETLPLILHEDKLYLYTIENRLLILSVPGFKETASLPVKNLTIPPIIKDGELFLLTEDLEVYDAGSMERKYSYNQLSERAYQKEVKRKKLEARQAFSANDQVMIKRFFPQLDAVITDVDFGEEWVLLATKSGELHLLSLPGLDWRWRAEVGAEVTTGLLLRGETVFLGDARGYLRALAGFHGEVKWQLDLASGVVDLLAGGDLFFATTADRRLYAIDAAAAKVRWYFKSGGKIDHCPVYSEGLVIFGAADGKLYLIDVEKGDSRYAAVDIGGAALTAPLVIGETVIIAAAGVGVRCYAIGAKEITRQWEYKCRNLLPDCLVGDEEVTVLATTAGELILLNSSDGSLIWNQEIPRRVKSPLRLLSGRVAFVDEFNKLRLFSLTGGEELWSVALAGELLLGPIKTGEHLQLLLAEGKLVDYNDSGKIVCQRKIRPGAVSGLLRYKNKLFVALRRGQLLAYELAE